LAELKCKLAARDVEVGIGRLWRFFDKCCITLKKTPYSAERQPPDVAAAREARQLDLDPAKLVFIDETGTTTRPE
jgi:hypothetical protein